MKSREEILSFLNSNKPSSFTDKSLTSYFIQSIFSDLHFSFNESEWLPSFTFQNFIEYFIGTILQHNTYYQFEHNGKITLGLFSGWDDQTHYPTFSHIIKNDYYDQSSFIVISPETNIYEITSEQLSYIQSKLRNENKYYRKIEGISKAFTEFIPGHLYWCYNIISGDNILAIVNPVCNGKLEVVTYVDSENNIHFDQLEYLMDNIENYIFMLPSKNDRKIFDNLLFQNNKEYSMKTKRVRPLLDCYRATEGETYYYIDSVLNIKNKKDTNCVYDQKRVYYGNYFRSKDEAERALSVLRRSLISIQASSTIYDNKFFDNKTNDKALSLKLDNDGKISKQKKGKPSKKFSSN